MKPKHLILLRREDWKEPFEYFLFDDTIMYNFAESDLQKLDGTKYHFPNITKDQWKTYAQFFRQSQEARRNNASNLIKSLTELRGQN
ncbi:hypothetical protein HOK76_01130 [archaeon]|jgi:hypothetical protein|nr:hypothetical protein [archaeon]